jgi:hypothetical protein
MAKSGLIIRRLADDIGTLKEQMSGIVHEATPEQSRNKKKRDA